MCTPTPQRCQGARLEVCNAGGTAFALSQQCASAALCNPVAGCQAAACTPSQLRCSGGSLEQCNANGTAFDVLQDCGSAQLCNGPAGRCNACVPAARRCANSSTAAVCDAAGLAETTTACLPLVEGCEGGECVLLDINLPF